MHFFANFSITNLNKNLKLNRLAILSAILLPCVVLFSFAQSSKQETTNDFTKPDQAPQAKALSSYILESKFKTDTHRAFAQHEHSSNQWAARIPTIDDQPSDFPIQLVAATAGAKPQPGENQAWPLRVADTIPTSALPTLEPVVANAGYHSELVANPNRHAAGTAAEPAAGQAIATAASYYEPIQIANLPDIVPLKPYQPKSQPAPPFAEEPTGAFQTGGAAHSQMKPNPELANPGWQTQAHPPTQTRQLYGSPAREIVQAETQFNLSPKPHPNLESIPVVEIGHQTALTPSSQQNWNAQAKQPDSAKANPQSSFQPTTQRSSNLRIANQYPRIANQYPLHNFDANKDFANDSNPTNLNQPDFDPVKDEALDNEELGNSESPSNDLEQDNDKESENGEEPENEEEPDNDDNSFVPRVASAAKKTKKTKTAAGKKDDELPAALIGAKKFVLAAQPQIGDHWKKESPIVDKQAWASEPILSDFPEDPTNPYLPYDPFQQMDVYEGKTLNSNQRPILELGRPWYQLGQLSPGYSWFGKHNNITPQFLVYGDVRTAVASNTQDGDNSSQVAFEVNLDFDLKLTGTERFHMFMSPLDDGNNTRFLLDDDEFVEEFDADIDFGYFEGDLGAIVGGLTNKTLPFDLPFAVGVMPLIFQNGIWLNDAFLGVAATLPARNSPRFNISNMDITFFAGYDKITSDAFAGDDSAAKVYGMASFIEATNGYWEIDYAFLDDRTFDDRSYHNIGIGFTRRYGRFLSNSTRIIVNAGQNSDVVENTADGVLLLSENSLITSSPSTLVPYFNMFAGFDSPQSVARANGTGGVLANTGILFESDGITNYPTLDPTANDTFGGAFGVNLIADDFSQQLVVEAALLGVMGEDSDRNAPGAQYGVGFRYQLPLTNSIIFRTDGMYGFFDNSEDVRGLRFELRRKY